MRCSKFPGVLAIAAVTMLALATAANASIIFVVDAPNDQNSLARGSRSGPPYSGPVSQTFDLSTAGDSAAGLGGSLTVSGTHWFEPNGPALAERFNNDYAGDLNGSSDIATWTATGYAPGTTVDVYSVWRSRGHYAASAPYTINGGTPIGMDMRTPSAGDLVLHDGIKNNNFEFVGSGIADGTGQVQVTVTGQGGWTPVDAIALRSEAAGPPPPPPAEATILKPVSVSTSITGDAGSSHLYLLDDNPGYAPASLQRPTGTGVTLNTGDPLSDAMATVHELTGTGHAESWTRPTGAGLPEFVFDLTGGGDTPVESILLWQYGNNGGGPNRVGNHTKDFRVILHTEAEGATFDFGTETADLDDIMDVIEQASTPFNVAQLFDFASVQNARYAAFRIDDNYGGEPGIIAGGDRYGLGEVRFVAPAAGPEIIPEPSTLLIWSLLAGLGIGAGCQRRRRVA